MNGQWHDLWRAVDQDGQVLAICLQTRRDKQAAKRFFKQLLKGLRYVPRVVVTATRRSYGAALTEIMPRVEHRQPKGLTSRVELSPQPTRQQERQRRGFKSAGQAQCFLSAHAPINNFVSLVSASLDRRRQDRPCAGLRYLAAGDVRPEGGLIPSNTSHRG